MIGGQGIPLSLKGLPANQIQLAAGQTFIIPSGGWEIMVGPSSVVQYLDPVASIPATTGAPSQVWRSIRQQASNMTTRINSDGTNFRIANLSGCAVGAAVTNVGSGYVNGVNSVGVTSSAGGSLWRSVVGGLINTSTTLPSPAGTNFTYPPIVLIPPPPPGGIQATAHATISGGAVNAVVVDNQGGGYTTAPVAFYIADPRDPNNPLFNPNTTTPITMPGVAVAPGTVTGASAGGVLLNIPSGQCSQSPAFALTGTGTLAGVYCVDPGNPVTSLPTLTFASGAGAATVLMNWSVTGFTATTGGTGYGNAQPFAVRTINGLSTATTVNTQPAIEKFMTQPRQAIISGTTTAGGAITATGAIVQDAGIGFQIVPTCVVDCGITGGVAPPTVVAVATATVGGTTDWFWLTPADA